jgi:CheY-like chemotaxis protein/HPt (histidine-containing phosphotransfer) domain-containing protein
MSISDNRTQSLLNEMLDSIVYLKKEKQSQAKYLKLIAESGIQISEMIENSLDMFKMEENTYKFNPCPCDIVKIFQKLSADLNQLVKQKNLDLEFYINDQLMTDVHAFWISGEYRLLQNLFANLIKNAIEASPLNNKIRIDVDDHDNNTAMIQIHNMGVVPERIRDQFFDRYATSGKKSGTGLGTYSAKLITRTHKGDIRFETDDTMGTILFVTLPTAQEPEIDSNTLDHQSVPVRLSGSILIADDNLINQQVLKGLLEDHPITLDLVENGQEAVESVMTQTYDLILMDLEMPVMDGREAIIHIRQHHTHKELPIIALTAHNLEIEDFNHTDQLLNDIIIKPIQPDILFRILSHYLGSDVIAQNTDMPAIKVKQANAVNQQILNIDQALRQLMGKRYLLDNVMQSFRKDHFNAPEVVKELIESDQLSTALRKVHSIKGLAGTIGAQALQRTAQELETALKDKMLPKLNQLVTLFKESLDPVIERIDQIIPKDSVIVNEDPSISNTLSDQLDSLENNINHLYTLLIDCDSEANDACDECLPALDYMTQNTKDHSLLDQLKHCLKNYLFDDAALVLEEICKKLGLNIDKDI